MKHTHTHIFEAPAIIRLIAFVAALVMTATVTSAQVTPQYRIVDLGEGTHESVAYGINSAGEVVGRFYSFFYEEPFIWLPNADSAHDLPAGVTVLTSAVRSEARSINDARVVVGVTRPLSHSSSWLSDLGVTPPFHTSLEGPLDDPSFSAAFAVNNEASPKIVGWLQRDVSGCVGPSSRKRGFRLTYTRGTPPSFANQDLLPVAPLDPDCDHTSAFGISDSGLAVGRADAHNQNLSDNCWLEEENRGMTWGAQNNTLQSLQPDTGYSYTNTEARDANANANSTSDVVGVSYQQLDICRRRAAFWNEGSGTPTALPFLLDGNNQPIVDAMEAEAISERLPELLVVGRSVNLDAAVLWRGQWDNGLTWTAYNLDIGGDVGLHNTEDWIALRHAYDVNNDGWIVGDGVYKYEDPKDGEVWIQRAFLLIPCEACPADFNCDGVVDVLDNLQLLDAWGACPGCPEDLNGDDVVDVLDLLILLDAWGPCLEADGEVEPLAQVLDAVGLTTNDWDDYVDVVSGTNIAEIENWNCWMKYYLSGCCHTRLPCPDSDPFDN